MLFVLWRPSPPFISEAKLQAWDLRVADLGAQAARPRATACPEDSRGTHLEAWWMFMVEGQ